MSAATPLSAAEQRWVKRLRRVFRDMPERLKLVEAGDSLHVVDYSVARDLPMYDANLTDERFYLCVIPEAFMKVTGVSG